MIRSPAFGYLARHSNPSLFLQVVDYQRFRKRRLAVGWKICQPRPRRPSPSPSHGDEWTGDRRRETVPRRPRGGGPGDGKKVRWRDGATETGRRRLRNGRWRDGKPSEEETERQRQRQRSRVRTWQATERNACNNGNMKGGGDKAGNQGREAWL